MISQLNDGLKTSFPITLHGPGNKNVQVPKIIVLAQPEMFITDIAFADNGQAAIDYEELVMHSAI